MNKNLPVNSVWQDLFDSRQTITVKLARFSNIRQDGVKLFTPPVEYNALQLKKREELKNNSSGIQLELLLAPESNPTPGDRIIFHNHIMEIAFTESCSDLDGNTAAWKCQIK